MPSVLKQVSEEFGHCRAELRRFQQAAVPLQDALAKKTADCYWAQKGSIRWQAFAALACQVGAGLHALQNPKSELHKLISALGQAATSLVFEPLKLDHQSQMAQINSSERQTYAITDGIRQLTQTMDTAEQNLQQSRQAAHH